MFQRFRYKYYQISEWHIENSGCEFVYFLVVMMTEKFFEMRIEQLLISGIEQ